MGFIAVVSLEWVLKNWALLIWSNALFANTTQELDMATPCMVHDPYEVETEELDLPDVAIDLGYKYVIDFQTLQRICANMIEQQPSSTVEQHLQALLFYLKNDAFIIAS